MAENPMFSRLFLEGFSVYPRIVSAAAEAGHRFVFLANILMKTNQILSIYSLDSVGKV